MVQLDLRRLALQASLTLPTPLLRALAGGGVVNKDGRTLDPRLQYLASQARRHPPLHALTPPEARVASAQALSVMSGRIEPGVRVEALSLPGPAGSLMARGYRPEAQDPDAPLMVFAHSGGGVVGDLDTCQAFCSILAREAAMPILSVAYRLAPDDRFPAALDDVAAAFRFALEHSDRFGAPLGQAAVGGDCIGGAFAAVIAQQARRSGAPAPTLQLLIYPLLDVAAESPSMFRHVAAWPLSRATLSWFMGNYMSAEDAPADLRLSPLRAEDLSGLSPAVIAIAGFDPLADQGETYARRLRASGTQVRLLAFDQLGHGFTAFTGVVPAADAACRQIARTVRRTLAGREV